MTLTRDGSWPIFRAPQGAVTPRLASFVDRMVASGRLEEGSPQVQGIRAALRDPTVRAFASVMPDFDAILPGDTDSDRRCTRSL